MSTRRCPHCKKRCDVGIGTYIDDQKNIRCIHCSLPLIALNSVDELKIKKTITLFPTPTIKEYKNNYYENDSFSTPPNKYNAKHILHTMDMDDFPA